MKDLKDKLIEKLKEAGNLLNSAKCPDCDGSGVIVREITETGTRWIDDGKGNPLPEPYPIQECEPSQCFWCYHKDNLLSEIAALGKQIEEQDSDDGFGPVDLTYVESDKLGHTHYKGRLNPVDVNPYDGRARIRTKKWRNQ